MSAALSASGGSCRRPLRIVIRLLPPVGNSVPAGVCCCSSREAEYGPANQRRAFDPPLHCLGLMLELLRPETGCLDILKCRS